MSNETPMAVAMEAQADSREAKHNQLLDALNNLRTVTDHVNDLALDLGVKRSEPIPEPMTATKEPNTVDNLVNVLDMLPHAMRCEVERIHTTLSDIKNSLI